MSRMGLKYVEDLLRYKGDTKTIALERIRKVLKILGDPQDAVRTILVAGTNGKGSTAVALASILASGGKRVGLTISPHLYHPSERIVLDGSPIDDPLLGALAEELKAAAEQAGLNLTMHEGMTALAFLAFREAAVDIAVAEVGLGGRLDSTNVIAEPELSVITTINFDHEHVLGHTLAAIAAEKGGIARPNGLMITGMLSDDAFNVLDSICKLGRSQHVVFNRDFGCSTNVLRRRADFWDCMGNQFSFRATLKGAHQSINMAVAARAGLQLGASQENCVEGIEGVYWPGRIEVVRVGKRDVIIDCAHNPHGVQALTAYLGERDCNRLDICFGALETKNWRKMLKLLSPLARNLYLVRPESESAVDPALIESALSCNDIKCEDFGTDYGRCLREAITVETDVPLVITGSIYLVGRLRKELGLEHIPLWRRGAGS